MQHIFLLFLVLISITGSIASPGDPGGTKLTDHRLAKTPPALFLNKVPSTHPGKRPSTKRTYSHTRPTALMAGVGIGILTPLGAGVATGSLHFPLQGAFDGQPAWDEVAQSPTGGVGGEIAPAYGDRYGYIDFGPNYADTRITGTWTQYRAWSGGDHTPYVALWWDDDTDNINDNGVAETRLNFNSAVGLPHGSAPLWVEDTNHEVAPITPPARYLVCKSPAVMTSRAQEYAIVGFVQGQAPPAAPTDLAVTTTGTTEVTLGWTDHSDDETGFEVERSVSPGTGFSWIHTTVANTTNYTDTGLSANTTYYYRVRAISGAGNSSYSPELAVTTAPASPGGVYTILSPVAAGQGGGGHFPLEKAFDAQPAWDEVSQSPTGGVGGEVAPSYGDRYGYIDFGLGYADVRITFTWTQYRAWSGGDHTPYMELWWDDDTDNVNDGTPETGLNFNSAVGLAHTGEEVWVKDTDHSASPITPAGRYLMCKSPATMSARAKEYAIVGFIHGQLPFSAPTGLSVSSTSPGVSLSWTDNTEDETGFEVERSLTPGTGFSLLHTSAANVTVYTDTTVQDHTTYYYRVRAVKDAQFSNYSPELRVDVPGDEGNVPDSVELAVLRDIMEVSHGLYRLDWPSLGNWPGAATSSEFGAWSGVQVEHHDIVALWLGYNDIYNELPNSIVHLTELKKLDLESTLLYGIPQVMPALTTLYVSYNNMLDFDHAIGNITSLEQLSMINYGGGFDFDLGNLDRLRFFEGASNSLASFPDGLLTLTSLESIYLPDNELDSVPVEIVNLENLRFLNLANNQLSSLPAGLSAMNSFEELDLGQNALDFEDLEPFFTGPGAPKFTLYYADQSVVTASYTLILENGQPLELPVEIGGHHSQYQWEFHDQGTWQAVDWPNENPQGTAYQLAAIGVEHEGEYRYRVTNSWVTGLSFTSSPITVKVSVPSPSFLASRSMGSETIRLSWDAVPGVDYQVERSLTGTTGFHPVEITSSSPYWDTGLAPGTSYYYRVRTSHGGHTAAYSPVASATTGASVPISQQLTHQPQYNGNISAVKWQGYGDAKENLYTYHYDPMSRLEAAHYSRGVTTGGTWTAITRKGGFSVHDIQYDLNGNIQQLKRQAFEEEVKTIDALSYSYPNGNQLSSVSDLAGWSGFSDRNPGVDYAYDDNGNMIQDLNKEITRITYNHLNLPDTVLKADGSYITYLYDATGIKLAQAVYNTSHELIKKTEYVGEFIYESEGTPSTELAFIHHDEGRIVPNPVGDGYDYEYYLKDHLGNTRVTFTTKPKTHTFYTNYEDTSDDDQALFEDVTTVSNDIFDHTDQLGTTYTHAQLLNGTEGSRIGSVIAIPVGMGDTLNAKVYAKYVEMTTDLTNAVTSLATSLVNAFTGGIGGTNELGNQSINNNFGSGSLIGTNGFQADNTAPMAFLSVMFLPEGETIDLEKDVSFAYDQISSTASQPIGQPKNTNYDELRIDNLVAPAPGYMLVYLSNESSTIAEVYFDDLTIEVKEDPVIQTDDYYPFGLTFNSYQRVTAKENRYLYNQGIGDIQFKTERITDLDLNLDMTKYRMYDYATGRFTQVDPLADANPQESLTPYQYSFNNPIRYNDPNGDCPPWLCGAVIGAAVDYGLQVGVNIAQGKSLGDALTEVDGRSILVSAAAGAVSGGISSISKLKNASKLIRAATEITVDAGASAANQLTTTGKIDGTDLLIDVAAAQTVGKIVKNKVDANAKSSPEGKVLSEAADRKQRIANNRQEISKNGGRTRPNQQNKANQAKQRFDSHGASRAVASGTASSGAVSTTLKQASQQSSGGGGREIEHNKLNYPTGILGRGN